MWSEESVFYQIYPLGFCGAPFENDGKLEHRILKVLDWLDHIVKLGANAIYFSPIFESDTHGYNTRDYHNIDVRLGTNEDFSLVCRRLHENQIKVVLDGVFNHSGRGFAAFQDVLRNRQNSKYINWFYIDFNRNSSYNDGLYYEGWEGNYDLVKLNLQNPEVVQYLIDSVSQWIDEFDIDGIRLDVAYCLDRDFMKRLRYETNQKKKDFFLVGEMLHGDYNQLIQADMLDSVTNYECYKGIYSSFNSMNLFEIIHSLLRQFGEEQWTLYRGKHLLTFADNHDVSRIASILTQEEQLFAVYTLIFTMPGIPCVYYGSEWGAKGDKKDGDQALRSCFDQPVENELTLYIGKLASLKKQSNALNYGSFRSIYLSNRQCVFERWFGEERLLIAINADGNECKMNADFKCITMEDVLSHNQIKNDGELILRPYESLIFKAQM